jgi:hypothetical protein
MHTRELILSVVFLLSVHPIMAQTQGGSISGSEMLQYCGTADRVVSQKLPPSEAAATIEEAMVLGFCVGAVSGVRSLAAASTQNTHYPICVPENAPSGQVLGAVVRYFNNHPERLNDDFFWIIMDALREGWPCGLSAQNSIQGQSLPHQ